MSGGGAPGPAGAVNDRRIVIYPVYLNSKRTLAQGRRVPAAAAVDDPSLEEIGFALNTLQLPGVCEMVNERRGSPAPEAAAAPSPSVGASPPAFLRPPRPRLSQKRYSRDPSVEIGRFKVELKDPSTGHPRHQYIRTRMALFKAVG